MSDAPFETSRQLRLAQSEAFLEAVDEVIDWRQYEHLVAAIDAKVGVHLSTPLLRLGLVSCWLDLDAHEIEDACRLRPALGQFVASSGYSPVVDIWVYQQMAPRMQGAAVEFGELAAAIEDELVVRGLRVSMPRPEPLVASEEPAAVDWANTTIVASDGLIGWQAAPSTQAASRDRTARAIVVFPWGEVVDVRGPVRIGRDPEFSPHAHRLDADRWISRRHVTLEPSSCGIVVRDAGSSNGTMVDTVRVGRNQSRLIDGDCTVRIGSAFACKIVFYPPA